MPPDKFDAAEIIRWLREYIAGVAGFRCERVHPDAEGRPTGPLEVLTVDTHLADRALSAVAGLEGALHLLEEDFDRILRRSELPAMDLRDEALALNRKAW